MSVSAEPKRVLIYGALCTECGQELSAWDFEGGAEAWPVEATLDFVREPLIHRWRGPCEGRLLLCDVQAVPEGW